jgi:hypothetical protein
MIEEFIFANQCSHGRNLEMEKRQNRQVKGDKLVGNYYVAFDKAYKVEIAQLMKEGNREERLKKSTNDSGSARNVLNGKLVTKRLFHFGKNEPMGL